MIPLQRYLSCLDDENLHRLFMLIFDDHQKLAEMSKDATKAFDWLIQNGDRWDGPFGRESQEVLVAMRREALDCVRRLLQRCAEACSRLARNPTPAFFRMRQPPIHEFVRKHYGLDERQLDVRAAYFRRAYVTKPFDPFAALGIYRWTDSRAVNSKLSFLEIESRNRDKVVLPSGEDIALRAGQGIIRIRVTRDRRDWEELPVLLLPHVPPVDHDGVVSIMIADDANH